MLFGTPSLLSFQFFVIVFYTCFCPFFCIASYLITRSAGRVKDRTDSIGTWSSMVDEKSIYGTGSSSAHAYYVTKWRTTYTQYKLHVEKNGV